MAHTVSVRETDETFSVEDDSYVLDSALKQDISFPRYCRSGVCGACKVTLVKGEVEMASFSTAALNDEEKGLRRILGCRSLLKSDIEIAYIPRDVIPRLTHKPQELNCRVAEIVQAGEDIKIVRLAVENEELFVFTAGQYATLAFKGLPPQAFSMANRPGEKLVEFHIRSTSAGEVGLYHTSGIAVGDPVKLSGPHGTAYLREYHGGSVVAVAGGTGVAPVKSIIDMALTVGMRQDIYLYLGVRREKDLYLGEHFTELAARHPNLHFTPVLSEPEGPTERRTGLVADAVAKDLEPMDGCRAYLFGPPPMVDAALAVVQRLGIRRRFVFSDHFEVRPGLSPA